MKLKRLSVATPSSSARDDRVVAGSSARRPASPPVSGGAPGGSSRSMRPRKSADHEYETASTASAYGAAQHGDEQTAELVADDERERAAAVDERVRLHVIGARHDHLDHRAVRDVEEHCQRAAQERDDVELRPAQVRRTRTRSGSTRSAGPRPTSVISITIRRPPAPVDPGTRVQREDQVRDQVQRRQHAHLARASRRARARRSEAARVRSPGRRAATPTAR